MSKWNRGAFLTFFVWFAIAGILFAAEGGYFLWQAARVTADPQQMLPEIRRVVDGYPRYFLQTELNQTKYGYASPLVVTKANIVLVRTSTQLLIAAAISLIVGAILASNYSRSLPRKPRSEVKSARYVDSVDSVSKGLSATAPVVISVIGAVSLLSASLNGFILAGIQVMILCLIVGIFVFPLSADLIIAVRQGQGKVVLGGPQRVTWELSTSAQFFLFILGLSLLAFAMITMN